MTPPTKSIARSAPRNLRITLLMISNFGVSDGGRETWAYNFIPRMLERWPDVLLDIIGLNRSGEPDNIPRLKALAPGRIGVTFLHSKRKSLPTLTVLRDAPVHLSKGLHHTPDLVIGVGSWMELLVVLRSPALNRAPRIVWLRTIWLHEKARRIPKSLRWLIQKMELSLLRKAKLVIANGADTAAHYRKLGLDVVVIPNGVDVSRWRCLPPSIDLPVRVGFVGRLIIEKGLEEFLMIAQELHQTGRFEFHVIGEGPWTPQVCEGQEQGWLVNHGARPNSELPKLLQTLDVCVALSFVGQQGGGGGVSNALLEQMAAGRVIVAWDNATYTQLLDDRNAYLVPQGDVAGLKAALESIAADPAGALQRAEAARRTAESYSFESHIQKFVEVAEPLFGGSAIPGGRGPG